MEYACLGKTGVKVSRLCLGGASFGGDVPEPFKWTLDYARSKPIIDRAVDLGINFFDTADFYAYGKSEEIIGRALEGRREGLVIGTKVYNPTGEGPNDRGLSRKHLTHALSRSLERLRTAYVDLYQIHRWDYETPIEETLTTLDSFVHSQGRARYIGASSMWAWQFAKAVYTSRMRNLEPFSSMQNQYNLVYREEEREMIPFCRAEGIAIIPYATLARGFLTGKYKHGQPPQGVRYPNDPFLRESYFRGEDFDVLARVLELSAQKGVTPAQLALAWVLSRPGVTSAIVGATSVDQLEALVGAIEIKVSDGDARFLEEAYRPRNVMGMV